EKSIVNFSEWRHISQRSITGGVARTAVSAKANRIHEISAQIQPLPFIRTVEQVSRGVLGLTIRIQGIGQKVDFIVVGKSVTVGIDLRWIRMKNVDFITVAEEAVAIRVCVDWVRL